MFIFLQLLNLKFHNMALDLHRKYIEKKQDSAPLVPIKDIINSKYYLDPLELLGERSFNEPREVDESEIGSPIQEFFRDAVVFLTGGTGFMGKVLVEKLLRTCPHIKHIYLLIRSKKGKNVDQRLEDIFEDRVNIYYYILLFFDIKFFQLCLRTQNSNNFFIVS
jgi:alcohol-forming fatty acyl-CoA reductase